MHEVISTWHKTRKVRGEQIKTPAEFMELLRSDTPGSVIVKRLTYEQIHPTVFVSNWAFRTVSNLIAHGMLYKTTTPVVRSTENKGGEHDPLQ
jgi:hypothetical protein